MITYILECLVFQLVFLLVYDLFLKKETFFQWNRVYLLVTFVLSLVLPWVKIEAFKTTMPKELAEIPGFMYQLDGVVLGVESATRFWEVLPWYYWIMGLGSVVAAGWLAHKLFQIIKLKRDGVVEHHPDFIKITVKESVVAFSFFRNIFLGGNIEKEREVRIIAHELVHIKQWHSLDLLFFELARIAFWFNPLVYVYQNRMAELHEFIADAKAVKHHKKAHFQMLLSEAFQTQNISFVNQFFNQSLIKKRIVMLQKKKSKAIWQLKYVVLLPIVLGMLVYTSCETEANEDENKSKIEILEDSNFKAREAHIIEVEDLDNMTIVEKDKMNELINKYEKEEKNKILLIEDKYERHIRINFEKGKLASVSVDKSGSVPFGTIEEVPIFPGCEEALDKRACFLENVENHIRKHFNYPKEAREMGIEGKVYVIFKIDANGAIADIRSRGPHELLEAEAERIINRLPAMLPGKQKGKAVDVPFSIPITFKL